VAAQDEEQSTAPVVEATGEEPHASRLHRRRASHLYGLIISGSVLAAAPETFGLARIALAVFGTLVVYWVAETYAHWIAARTVHRRGLTPSEERAVLRDGLPLVAACAVPVAVLLVEDLLDVDVSRGVEVALAVNIVLLLVVGWRMSRAGGLRGVRLVGSTLITGLLGVAMVGLKLTLHH
jgi:hypothetical protein